jgi:hypothetical protein
LADSQDCEESKDPPQFNRMPGYYIDDYDEKEFDSVEFKIKTEKNAIIEGHCFRLEYSVKKTMLKPQIRSRLSGIILMRLKIKVGRLWIRQPMKLP